MLAFLASLVMAFLLGFFLEATLGMIGFWFLEVSSLLFVYMLLNFFFSGQMFPHRTCCPASGDGGRGHAAAIPGLFPGGRVPGQDPRAATGLGLAVEAGLGAGVLSCRGRLAFHYGVRRYSALRRMNVQCGIR